MNETKYKIEQRRIKEKIKDILVCKIIVDEQLKNLNLYPQTACQKACQREDDSQKISRYNIKKLHEKQFPGTEIEEKVDEMHVIIKRLERDIQSDTRTSRSLHTLPDLSLPYKNKRGNENKSEDKKRKKNGIKRFLRKYAGLSLVAAGCLAAMLAFRSQGKLHNTDIDSAAKSVSSEYDSKSNSVNYDAKYNASYDNSHDNDFSGLEGRIKSMSPYESHKALISILYNSTGVDDWKSASTSDWQTARNSNPFLWEKLKCRRDSASYPAWITVLDNLKPYHSEIERCGKILPLISSVDIASLAAAESSGRHWDNDRRVLKSKMDAYGLMQITKAAYWNVISYMDKDEYVNELFEGKKPSWYDVIIDPVANIRVGSAYLYLRIKKFNSLDIAVNDYNWGRMESALKVHNKSYFDFLPAETKQHLKNFKSYGKDFKSIYSDT
jgi:hypothetical protein